MEKNEGSTLTWHSYGGGLCSAGSHAETRFNSADTTDQVAACPIVIEYLSIFGIKRQ